MSVGRIHRVVATAAATAVAALVAMAPGAQAAIPTTSYSIVPKPVDAGTVTVGGTKQFFVTVTNKSSMNLGFRPTGVTPANAAQAFSDDVAIDSPYGQDCTIFGTFIGPVVNVLAPGQSCRLYFTFEPRGTSGAKTGTANIVVGQYQYDGYTVPGDEYQTAKTTIPLKGKAGGLKLSIEPSALTYGTHTVGATEDQEVTIINRNDVAIEFAPGGVAPNPAQYRTNIGDSPDACAQAAEDGAYALVLGPGEQCRLPVRFAPTSPGTKTGTITVNMFLPGEGYEPGYRENVTGRKAAAHTTFKATGKAVAVAIEVNQLANRRFSVSFGNVLVGDRSVKPAIVFNPGDTSLIIYDGPLTPSPSPFSSWLPSEPDYPNGCFGIVDGSLTAHILPPRSSCLVYYAFEPSATGAKTANATVIAWNASAPSGDEDIPETKPQAKGTVQLKGTGVKAG